MEILSKETTWIILAKLPSRDLISLLSTNRYLKEVVTSEDFARYRFHHAGYPAEIMIQIKPKDASYLEWFDCIVDKKILDDPICLQLNLTVEEAYQRSQPYQRHLRNSAVLLIEAMQRRHYDRFCQELALFQEKDLQATSNYFEIIDYEIIKNAVLTDQPKYLRKLIEKLADKLDWSTFFVHWIHHYLIHREIYEMLVPFFDPKDPACENLRILEEVAEGKIFLDYLAGKPIQVTSETDFTTILLNLEVRNLEKATSFFEQYKDYPAKPNRYILLRDIDDEVAINHPFDGVIATQHYPFFRMSEEINYTEEAVPTILLLPTLALPEDYSKEEIDLALTRPNGIYFLIEHLAKFEIDLDELVTDLIEMDDAWDAIVYLILSYSIQLDLENLNLSKKKKDLLEAVMKGETSSLWQMIITATC